MPRHVYLCAPVSHPLNHINVCTGVTAITSDPMGRRSASGHGTVGFGSPRLYVGFMDGAPTGSEPVVTLTPYAVEMVRKVRARDGLSDRHALRVAVVGGGCSGFSYQLDFDEQA